MESELFAAVKSILSNGDKGIVVVVLYFFLKFYFKNQKDVAQCMGKMKEQVMAHETKLAVMDEKVKGHARDIERHGNEHGKIYERINQIPKGAT